MVRYFSCAAALCLGALVFQTAAAADALSFDEARALFHERSDIFRVDAAEVERARLTAESAKWLSGPKIDMMAMHMEGRKELDLDIDVPANLQAMGPCWVLWALVPFPSLQRLTSARSLTWVGRAQPFRRIGRFIRAADFRQAKRA